jgi:hypothetical protein
MSDFEESLAGALLKILEPLSHGELIPTSSEFKRFLSGLEYSIPELLKWKHESLDGILPYKARKTGPGEAEISAECILISDQTTSPLHLRMQADTAQKEFVCFECRLGQKINGEMKRFKYGMMPMKILAAIAEKPDSIDWFYKITFGQAISR